MSNLDARVTPAEHIEAALWALDADHTETAEMYLWQALGYRDAQVIHVVLRNPKRAGDEL